MSTNILIGSIFALMFICGVFSVVAASIIAYHYAGSSPSPSVVAMGQPVSYQQIATRTPQPTFTPTVQPPPPSVPTLTQPTPISTPSPTNTPSPTTAPLFADPQPTPTAAPVRQRLPGASSYGVGDGRIRLADLTAYKQARGIGSLCEAFDPWGAIFVKGGRWAEDGSPLIDELWRIASDGSFADRMLFDLPIVGPCQWSPNGGWLAVQLATGLAIAERDTTGHYWLIEAGTGQSVKIHRWTDQNLLTAIDSDGRMWLFDPLGNGRVVLETETLTYAPSMTGQQVAPWSSD